MRETPPSGLILILGEEGGGILVLSYAPKINLGMERKDTFL